MERVRIVDSNGVKHFVVVPPGVDDIVKPYWLDEVIVTGTRGPKGTIVLVDIEAAPIEEEPLITSEES